MVEYNNDKHHLIYNLLVKKHWRCERIMKTFSNKPAHFNYK